MSVTRLNDFSGSGRLMDRARRHTGAWLDAHPVAVGC